MYEILTGGPNANQMQQVAIVNSVFKANFICHLLRQSNDKTYLVRPIITDNDLPF